MPVVAKRRHSHGPKPYTRQHSSAVKSPPSPKRKNLTYYDKLEIINFCRANQQLTQAQVALYFRPQFPRITQTTISRYLSQEADIHEYIAKYPDRLGHARRCHGEATSAPTLERVELEIRRLQHIIGRYLPQDVYDFDEAALYFGVASVGSLSNRLMAGVEAEKFRLTCGLAVNFTGTDKRPPFILGKAARPYFEGHIGTQLGFDYDTNTTACMTATMWHGWLFRFDADMRRRNRHVMLLCDNARWHKKPKHGQYPNVHVEYLAAGLTAFAQPLDAGIIEHFKELYHRAQKRRAIQRATRGESNSHHIDQLAAMRVAQVAWDAVSAKIITDCWRRTQICPPNFGIAPEVAQVDSGAETTMISELQPQPAMGQLAERQPHPTLNDSMPVEETIAQDVL
ncbi:hypothetical protein FRC09_011265 [Ceratobasidium sp. 395]|nr:hypothetical protein FRC09_011265 [Ceratobasidium sp. 395]